MLLDEFSVGIGSLLQLLKELVLDVVAGKMAPEVRDDLGRVVEGRLEVAILVGAGGGLGLLEVLLETFEALLQGLVHLDCNLGHNHWPDPVLLQRWVSVEFGRIRCLLEVGA